MRINTNVAALNAQRNLGITNMAVSSSMSRLSSGFRINRAADDAAGLAIANEARNTVRSLTQASRNIEQGNAVLQISEGSAGTIGSILERMKELATQAASSTNSGELDTLDDEFDTLAAEINRIVGSTTFQGDALIDGTFSGTLQIGATNSVDDRITVALGDLDTDALGIASSSILTLSDAQTAMASIDAAIGTVNGVLGDIGAAQNRLEYAASNLSTAIVNVAAAESVIRDVDMAAEVSTFSKNQILQQAGTAMLAQANQSAQNVLQLLRG